MGHQSGPTVEEYSAAQDRIVQRFMEKFAAAIEQVDVPRISPEEEGRDKRIVRQWCECNGIDIEKKAEEFQRKMARLSSSNHNAGHKAV